MDSSIIDMLIRFNVSIDELINISSPERSHLMSEFIRASRLGSHRIVVPRGTADWVLENVNLAEIDLAHLKRLRSEYTQLAGQIEQATLAIVVTDGGGVSFSDSGRIVSMGYKNVIAKDYLQRPVFLTENAKNDGCMLDIIVSHESRRRSFGAVAYDSAHGGGIGIADELKRFVELGRVVACVCDTDIKVPDGKRSDTYNKVIAAASQLALVGIATGTPGSEIENFIPLNIIDKMYGNINRESIDKLIGIMDRQGECECGECFWLYFDLKRGTTEIEEHCNTLEKLQWARSKLPVDCDTGQIERIDGFGEKIVSDFLSDGSVQPDFFRFSRSDYWKTHFAIWIEKILWVICGRVGLRTG